MRLALALGAAVAAVSALSLGRRRGRLTYEVRKRAHLNNFEPHTHFAVVHDEEHPHVTHNRRQGADAVVGEWEHLTAVHTHEHNHPQVSHGHLPHEDAQHEHLGEAHIHDHSHPTQS